jgi:hypothetical protein
MAKRTHRWEFFRAGGVDQVVLKTGSDIAHLRDLDQKLWVALACPTKGTELDEKTLAMIDTDQDGRVRAPEVLAAVDWSSKVFKTLDLLFERGDTVPLAALDGGTEEGKAVLASAKRILADQGKRAAKEIGLGDVLAMEQVFAATRFNGDGIVPAESADDEATRHAIEQVLATMGARPDRSGKPGVDRALVDAFFEQASALLAWDAEGKGEGVLPLGEATAAAAEAFAAVTAKAEDYYTRCRIAAYDSRAALALNADEAELRSLSSRTLTLADDDVAKLTLARVEPNRPLPLAAGLNPAWAERVAAFARATVTPLLEARTTLTEAEFAAITSKLAAFCSWQARKPAGPVAELGAAPVRELVAGDAQAKIVALIDQDAALEGEYAQIASVERAVRFRRDLLRLLRNFVNFADFYGRKGAVFQAGTLYLDGRACDLTIPVNDPAKHAALAGLSKAYLAYCECTRGADEKSTIVAAFTAGDVDALMVGRNGLFYDRKDRDWDARITNIVENPISVRQAFWSPYKRLVRLVEEQVAKRAAEKEKASSAKMDSTATAAATADKAPAAGAPEAAALAAPGTPAAPPAKKIDVGMVAAVGVAVAGAATFLASVLGLFLGLGVWMPLGVAALLLAISMPSMLIAWLKLRQRNLGPILDANGWAINARVRVNVPFGGSLTKVAKLPEGATRTVDDPYAEKPSRWWLWLVLLAVLGLAALWALGKADSFLPESVRASKLLHRPGPPPAPTPAPPPAPARPAGHTAPAK